MTIFHAELEAALSAHRQGRIEEAEAVYRKLINSESHLAEPWHLMGVIHLQKGDPAGSESYLRNALKRDDKHVKCHSNLGAALYQLGRQGEAEIELRHALRLDPSYTEARYNLGNVLMDLDCDFEAIKTYQAVLKDVPNHVNSLINAAFLLYQNSFLYKAEDFINSAEDLICKAVSIDPDNFFCLLNLARISERLNKLDRAQEAIDKALSQQPDHPDANLYGAKIKLRNKQPDHAIVLLNTFFDHNDENAFTQIDALHTYGQALHELGRSDEAFAAHLEANQKELYEVRKDSVHPLKFQDRLDCAHKRLNSTSLAPSASSSVTEPQKNPVFFVGFPRSGTTLFEQMLANHPAIVTTNEASPLAKVAKSLDFNVSFHELKDSELSKLRTEFWQEAQNITSYTEDLILIDKMPLNIEFLDLATRLFPKCKVVMSLRDPRDVCLSCFMQHFSRSDALSNFLTLEDTALIYDKAMSLWQRQKEILPMQWVEFRYEDLVEDLEATVKPILSFLGLEWDDEILSYHDRASMGHILTPSYTQVGEKLHSRAKGRWRKYEKQLNPILKTLSPYVQSFGYGDDVK